MAEPSAPKKTQLHPLQFKWALWHDVVDRKKTNYAANLSKVATFDTVEDFWALFNNLKEPSQLNIGSTYNLFKDGIEPKWEDIQNQAGGEWRVSLPVSKYTLLDEYWINTLLTVIGEGFGPEESDDIAGIVVNRRKSNNRIAIWTKTALDKDRQMQLGRHWRATTNITTRLEYLSFKDAMGKGAGRPKPRYSLD